MVQDGIIGKDLSYIYQNEEREIYIDYCHPNDYGNKVLIDEIVRIIDDNQMKLRGPDKKHN